MTVRIITGDCRDVLRSLESESVHCIVTSPPYWGLRDYGIAGQIGLEPNYFEFVSQMVNVFREVHRVLRPDGTLWLNLGDSYATGAGKVGDCPGGGKQGERWKGGPPSDKSTLKGNGHVGGGPKLKSLTPVRGGTSSKRPAMGKHEYLGDRIAIGPGSQPNRMPQPGLKPKDLVGIPWRVAFALQADGWYLRQDIIWSKPNPMPESVRDRCTKAHEYLFLLSKSERYYYDQDAIREPFADASIERLRQDIASQKGSDLVPGKTNGAMKAVGLNANRSSYKPGSSSNMLDGEHVAKSDAGLPLNDAGRNRRSVWKVMTQPFSLAHFATFPPALIEPCIKAGCPVGGTVLDPFGGAGTTGLVADRLQRDAILIELNSEYAAMARRRIDNDRGALLDAMEAESNQGQLFTAEAAE